MQLYRTKLKKPSGFALISTLSVVVLLALTAVGLLSLSTLHLRTAGATDDSTQAKANAKIALMEALSELQSAAGPDRRVTATADVMLPADAGEENASFSSVITSVSQPHLLGVWYGHKDLSYDPANGGILPDPPDYVANKTTETTEGPDPVNGIGFIKWLSSGMEKTSLDASSSTLDADTSIPIVSSGTSANPQNLVSAEPVEINNRGRYAWHIFDESQKANSSQLSTPPVSQAETLTAVNSAGEPGYQFLTDYSSLDALDDSHESRLISQESLSVAVPAFNPRDADSFFTLTSHSKNLCINIAEGGYQTDLSLLFAHEELPSEYNFTVDENGDQVSARHLYSDSTTPVAGAPDVADTRIPIASPDPTWALLHSHYRMYDSELLSGTAGSLLLHNSTSRTITSDPEELYQKGTDPSQSGWDVINSPIIRHNPQYTNLQQIQPIISNAQFVFSLTAGTTKGDPPYVHLVTDIIFTFWNPYNVPLTFSNLEVDMYRFPLALDFYRSNNETPSLPVNSVPVHVSDITTSDNSTNNATGNTVPYRTIIKGDYTLEPGQFITLAPTTGAHQWRSRHFTRGNEYGTAWDTDVGGFSVRRLLTSSTGNSVGTNGANTYWIRPDPGEELRMGVYGRRSARTDINLPEVNNKQVAFLMKIYQSEPLARYEDQTNDLATVARLDLDEKRTQIGVIELDLSDAELAQNLPDYAGDNRFELPAYDFPIDEIKGNPNYTYKEPFLVASLRLKTELDSDIVEGSPNASHWLHNGVTNHYFTNGILLPGDRPGQKTRQDTHQYELTWEPATSWQNTPMIELPGYGGTGVSSGTGMEKAVVSQIPLSPALSLSQLSHAPINTSGLAPLTSQIIGNAFASPLIPRDVKAVPNSGYTDTFMLDHSYMANSTLFDGYFLSSVTAETGPLFPAGRSLQEVLQDMLAGTGTMPGQNYILAETATQTDLSAVTIEDYEDFAQFLYNRGAFNVNSTSEDAWALFLSSGTQESLAMLNVLTGGGLRNTGTTHSMEAAFSRFSPLAGDKLADDVTSDSEARWGAHLRLSSDQIMELSRNVVKEVRQRGPFQSVSEFVNRQLIDGETGNFGTLQAAIEATDLSGTPINTDHGVEHNSSPHHPSNASDGAPSQLIQSDLLNRLAPSLTVRGDTFKIRSYGESENGVKIWCEAIVQRQHEYVDDSQERTTDPENLNAINEKLGRRFTIVSFKWLDENEV